MNEWVVDESCRGGGLRYQDWVMGEGYNEISGWFVLGTALDRRIIVIIFIPRMIYTGGGEGWKCR